MKFAILVDCPLAVITLCSVCLYTEIEKMIREMMHFHQMTHMVTISMKLSIFHYKTHMHPPLHMNHCSGGHEFLILF